MYIGYKNSKLKKICTEIKSTRKALPNNVKPERLYQRLRDLAAFDNLSDIPTTPPFRLHKLEGKRKEEWTVDLQGLQRIHFILVGDFETDANKNQIPKTVTEIEIVDIGDFHRW